MTTEVNGWPTLQIPPAPTDAELEAERDAKHAAAVESWLKADQQRLVIQGYFLAIEMVGRILEMGMREARAEQDTGDEKRRPIGLGGWLSLNRASERIHWEAASYGRQFSEYR